MAMITSRFFILPQSFPGLWNAGIEGEPRPTKHKFFFFLFMIH